MLAAAAFAFATSFSFQVVAAVVVVVAVDWDSVGDASDVDGHHAVLLHQTMLHGTCRHCCDVCVVVDPVDVDVVCGRPAVSGLRNA
mgnify:CR=1 FL=1